MQVHAKLLLQWCSWIFPICHCRSSSSKRSSKLLKKSPWTALSFAASSINMPPPDAASSISIQPASPSFGFTVRCTLLGHVDYIYSACCCYKLLHLETPNITLIGTKKNMTAAGRSNSTFCQFFSDRIYKLRKNKTPWPNCLRVNRTKRYFAFRGFYC